MRPLIDFDEEKHKYKVTARWLGVDQEPFPSVTTILNAVVPKELGWWGMTVGAAGVATMANDGFCACEYRERNGELSGDYLVDELKRRGLTTNHRRDKRGAVGTSIHKALELFGSEGKIPELSSFAEEDRPRVSSMAAWLLDEQPEFLGQEVRTASVTHRYAGTFDLRARMKDGRVGLIDLKTTKNVYPQSAFPQLEAYEFAEIECGEEPTDFRAVLWLPLDGEAQLVESVDTFDNFLSLLSIYRLNERRKTLLKSR